MNDASQGDTNPDGDSKEDNNNEGDTNDTNPDGDSKEDEVEENNIAKTKPEVVTKPLKRKITHKPGKPITSLSHSAKACKHKTLSGKGDKNEPQTGVNDDSPTGDSSFGDGQVTITVHSNIKVVIGGIKKKFSEYKNTLKPSLQLTCTLVVYKAIHLDDPFLCRFCQELCIYLKSLEKHENTKHNVKKTFKYSCTMCSKQTDDRTEFQVHVNRHTNVKPYKCNICEASYFSQSQLMAHMKTHNVLSDPKFECSVCGQKIVNRRSLS